MFEHQTRPTILSLFNTAERAPDSVAVLAPGREALSYQKLAELIARRVEDLHRFGIGRGDRVAMVLPNGPEMATSFLAVTATATAAPLNPAYQAGEFDFYLDDLKPRAVIVDAEQESPVREVARARGIPLIELTPQHDSEAGRFTLTGEEYSSSAASELAQSDDVALVLHTSGTTSRPKIVPLSHANVCASALNIVATLQLSPQDRGLNVMPLFHIHGLIAALLAPLSAGGSVVCTPGFVAANFLPWLDEFQPTWYTAVPTMHQAVLASAVSEAETVAGARLRFIRSSSAALPPQVMAELERVFDAPVIEAYGMTEAAHQMASNPLPPRSREPGSVGLAAGPEISIMDAEGNLLPTGETGEIVIRGANVFSGYANNPEANQSAYSSGWFRTGDQGRLDEKGYLFLTGRLKEIINRGGEKISPREIDEVLLDHPAVAQAVAFAAPHPTLGEDLLAAVVLHDRNAANEKQLRQFAFERLVPLKVPSRILVVAAIPKGPTGKLQRIGLYKALEVDLHVDRVAPRSELEGRIVSVFEQILETTDLGVTDNFFWLGGDSLKAARVLARLSSDYQVALPAVAMFHNPTAEELSLEIMRLLGEGRDDLEHLLDEIEAMSDEDARRLSA